MLNLCAVPIFRKWFHAVSYTHLDVYKRQSEGWLISKSIAKSFKMHPIATCLQCQGWKEDFSFAPQHKNKYCSWDNGNGAWNSHLLHIHLTTEICDHPTLIVPKTEWGVERSTFVLKRKPLCCKPIQQTTIFSL